MPTSSREVLLDGAPSGCSISTTCSAAPSPIEFVQEQSIANKKRLEARDPEARQQNLDELSRIAEHPERARQFLLRSAMIASQRRAIDHAQIKVARGTAWCFHAIFHRNWVTLLRKDLMWCRIAASAPSGLCWRTPSKIAACSLCTDSC